MDVTGLYIAPEGALQLEVMRSETGLVPIGTYLWVRPTPRSRWKHRQCPCKIVFEVLTEQPEFPGMHAYFEMSRRNHAKPAACSCVGRIVE